MAKKRRTTVGKRIGQLKAQGYSGRKAVAIATGKQRERKKK